ncbi:hypothetical protein C1645_820735 [Glomus cerebriforme]|uniref:Uncharacterized protein n=1 Tax=Glomus cerebriforme TaxID=658196 RepID=A0A397T244_9GLOM|nr:hypothetical protein C1645_820735 [Glomus cerebriforme]
MHDYKTKTGQLKSTNQIDDIIKLTEKGKELIKQIEAEIKKDKLYWYWVMYCTGDGNSYQHECGRIGKYIEGCQNEILSNNLKNYSDIHLLNHRADHKTTKNIKAKMLAPYNDTDEEVLRKILYNQKELCNDKKLHRFLGYILYYQQPDLSSAEMFDSKYDLNNDCAPVLAIIAKNDVGFGIPLAFDKKNKVYPIKKITGQLALYYYH